jgi:integrase
VAAAHRHDRKLGLLIEVLATTGTRSSQAVRLEVGDLHADPKRPKLMMPKSGKGGSRNRAARKAERYSVEITSALAAALKQEAAGRPADAPLLTRSNGAAWPPDPHSHYRDGFRAIVASIALDPDEVTVYALRHSFVVRMLLANVPVRIVASKIDSSVAMVEKNYSRHIAEHSDEISRRALLEIGRVSPDEAGTVAILRR